MHHTILAVLNENIKIRTIFGSLVRPCTLATLDCNSIIIYRHVASINNNVMTHVDVYCVAARSLEPRGGRIDVAVEIAHVVGVVEMIGPKGTVDEAHILYGDVVRVGDIDEAWALLVLVGALWIPLAPYPELLPIVMSVAIDGALAGNGEAVEGVGIYEGCEILACLSLDAGCECRPPQ